MHKDFRQPFEQERTRAYLTIKDSVSKKFLVYTNTADHEEDISFILDVEINGSESLTNQLARFLYKRRMVLSTYKELDRATSISFSFVDETPGVESVNVSFFVYVDVVSGANLDIVGARAAFVSLSELQAKLADGLLTDLVTDSGIARLMAEYKLAGILD